MNPKYFIVMLLALVLVASPLGATTCQTAQEMDPAAKSAIEGAAQQMLQATLRGEANFLQQNAIPDVANNFAGISGAVADNRENLQGAAGRVRSSFVLDASDAKGSIERAEFYCGIWGANGHTNMSTGFVIPGLPAGKYAVVVQDITGGKMPHMLSTILQQMNGQWKLAGFYIRPTEIGGHDGNWYLQKAREYSTAGQKHNAHFYYQTAWKLLAPVDFISTKPLEQMTDEWMKARPNDLPVEGPVQISANGRTYTVTDMTALPTEKSFDLNVRYQATGDLANVNQTIKENHEFLRALLAKYPELRQGFTTIIAHAVDSSGRSFPSPMAMKDVR
jgi:hypothetical protein